MTAADAELRDQVAAQLEELLVGTLASNGPRAVALLAQRVGRGSRGRERVWDAMQERYLARQTGIARDGRAALLTAGAPAAGKSTEVHRLGLGDEGWRRLDADIVKDYLLEELVAAGDVEDMLAVTLADDRPVMPRELASLVHAESVVILDRIRNHCLRAGENIVIEGTLVWEPAARRLMDALTRLPRDAEGGRGYHEVTIVDVEVPREVAKAQAIERWWAGRSDAAHSDLGGRWVPAEVIDRAYPDPGERRSVCARTARTLFDSDAALGLPLARLTIVDRTGDATVTETFERRAGVLQLRPAPQQLSFDAGTLPTAARLERQSVPPPPTQPHPRPERPPAGSPPQREPPTPGLSH